MTLADFKTPGADLGGVHYLRNVQDADSLLAAIQMCKEKGGKVQAAPLTEQKMEKIFIILLLNLRPS